MRDKRGYHTVSAAESSGESLLDPNASSLPLVEGKPDPLGEGVADMAGSVFNLINNVIGAGMLTLPYALRKATPITGLAVFTVVAVVNAYALILLARCCQLAGTASYREMGERALGRTAGILVQTMVLCYACGSCISYVILIGAS